MFNKGKKRDEQLREAYKDVNVTTRVHHRRDPKKDVIFDSLKERKPPPGRYKDFKTGRVTDHK